MATVNVSDIQSVVIVADGACPGNGKTYKQKLAYHSFCVFINPVLKTNEENVVVGLTGSPIHTTVKVENNAATNFQAEYASIIEALRYMAANPKRAALELTLLNDNETVINQINRQARVKDATLRTLWTQVTELVLSAKYQRIEGTLVKQILGH